MRWLRLFRKPLCPPAQAVDPITREINQAHFEATLQARHEREGHISPETAEWHEFLRDQLNLPDRARKAEGEI